MVGKERQDRRRALRSVGRASGSSDRQSSVASPRVRAEAVVDVEVVRDERAAGHLLLCGEEVDECGDDEGHAQLELLVRIIAVLFGVPAAAKAGPEVHLKLRRLTKLL